MFIDKIHEQETKKIIFGNIYFLSYYYGICIFSGFFYWLIYLYNKNLWRRFLILIHKNKEEDYLKEFEEENKIIEVSLNDTAEQSSQDNMRISMSDLSGIEKDNSVSIGLTTSIKANRGNQNDTDRENTINDYDNEEF